MKSKSDVKLKKNKPPKKADTLPKWCKRAPQRPSGYIQKVFVNDCASSSFHHSIALDCGYGVMPAVKVNQFKVNDEDKDEGKKEADPLGELLRKRKKRR